MTDAEIEISIRGASEVIAHYGQWPSFHDADLVKVGIDMRGPTVTIEFRLYDWDQTLERAKRPRLVMAWGQVDSIDFSGIDELGQNAVDSLKLYRPSDDDGEWVETTISSTGTGTTAQIRAVGVEVVHFESDENREHENLDSWQASTPKVVTQK